MKTLPDQSFGKLWNISFGFFGVQIAYALQSANISRIFSTLGADPHDLSYFWILPPLMGIIVRGVKRQNMVQIRSPYSISVYRGIGSSDCNVLVAKCGQFRNVGVDGHGVRVVITYVFGYFNQCCHATV